MYVYILKSDKVEKFYVGISQNPELRLKYHNSVEKGFTSRYRPWQIVWTKKYKSKSEAINVEKRIKSWKSSKMIKLVVNGDYDL